MKLLRFTLALLFAVTSCLAQETRGMIFGHVSDASSAAVARAKVTVKNTGTNVVTELLTNEAGYYEAPLLVAGSYLVTVEAPGFRKAEHPSFELQIASRLEVNFNAPFPERSGNALKSWLRPTC